MEVNKLSLLTYGAIGATCVILAVVTIFDNEAYGPVTPPGTDSKSIFDSLQSSFSKNQEKESEESPEEYEADEPTEPEMDNMEPTSEMDNMEPASGMDNMETQIAPEMEPPAAPEKPRSAPFGGISTKKNKTTKRKKSKKATRSRK